jgi:hypothetical protein
MYGEVKRVKFEVGNPRKNQTTNLTTVSNLVNARKQTKTYTHALSRITKVVDLQEISNFTHQKKNFKNCKTH